MSKFLNKQGNLLILSLNSLWQAPHLSSHDITGSISFIKLLLRFLRFIGYAPSTIQNALKFGAEKKIVLTYEIDDLTNNNLQKILNLHCPITLFIRTKWILPVEDHTASIEFSDFNTAAIRDNLLRAIDEKKWEIGLAGHELLDLTMMNQFHQLTYLKESLKIFSLFFGFNPTSFLYPLGAYDASTVSILRQLNFNAGITSIEGINSFDCFASENFHLRRLFVPKSKFKFLLKITKFILNSISSMKSQDSLVRDLAKYPSQ